MFGKKKDGNKRAFGKWCALLTKLGYNSKILVDFVNKERKVNAVMLLLLPLYRNHFTAKNGPKLQGWGQCLVWDVDTQGSEPTQIMPEEHRGLLGSPGLPTLSTKSWWLSRSAQKGPCPAQFDQLPPTSHRRRTQTRKEIQDFVRELCLAQAVVTDDALG